MTLVKSLHSTIGRVIITTIDNKTWPFLCCKTTSGQMPRSGVSFQTRGAEKVGIVGRTGSGKSSIFQALYRLAEIDRKENKSPIPFILASCLAVLRIRDVFIPDSGSRVKMFRDSGSTSKNLNIFTPKDP